MERLFDRRHDVLDAGDQVAVLGDRERDAGNVGFLERVVADQLARHLTGDADHRHRVHHRGRDAGDQVRGSRTRGGNRHAHAASRPGISIGHVRSALLVTNQDMSDRVVEHRVVRGQDRAAWVSEDRIYALMDETLPDDLRASSLGWHKASVHRRLISVKLILVRTR
jgi:hypothetical protein